MKNYLSILTIALLIAFVSCQPQPQQSVEEYQKKSKQKITEVLKLYLEAWENQDLDSVMTFLDDDYINMFNFSIYANKEQCQKMFKNVFDTYTFEDMEQKSLEIVIDQNFAFKTWLLKQTWTTNDKKDTTYFDMRGITIFKKQEDGSWKLFREIGQD